MDEVNAYKMTRTPSTTLIEITRPNHCTLTDIISSQTQFECFCRIDRVNPNQLEYDTRTLYRYSQSETFILVVDEVNAYK